MNQFKFIPSPQVRWSNFEKLLIQIKLSYNFKIILSKYQLEFWRNLTNLRKYDIKIKNEFISSNLALKNKSKKWGFAFQILGLKRHCNKKKKFCSPKGTDTYNYGTEFIIHNLTYKCMYIYRDLLII